MGEAGAVALVRGGAEGVAWAVGVAWVMVAVGGLVGGVEVRAEGAWATEAGAAAADGALGREVVAAAACKRTRRGLVIPAWDAAYAVALASGYPRQAKRTWASEAAAAWVLVAVAAAAEAERVWERVGVGAVVGEAWGMAAAVGVAARASAGVGTGAEAARAWAAAAQAACGPEAGWAGPLRLAAGGVVAGAAAAAAPLQQPRPG